jgi:tetratricopeptide (TPR) repeat protein
VSDLKTEFSNLYQEFINSRDSQKNMTDSLGSGRPQASRRQVIQTLSGITTLGILGTGASITGAAEPGEEQWTFETGDGIESSPTVVDKTVFVGGREDDLYAVDAETGEQQWTFETGNGYYSSPTVVDRTVFVGSIDYNLYAVDAETGEQQWTFKTGGYVESSPTVVDGTVFVGSGDHNLYSVDGDVDASSEGSRVMLGTNGHHADWQYAGQSINIPAYAIYTSWVRNNLWPFLGLFFAWCGIGIVGVYLIQQSNQEFPEESNDESSTPSSSETAQSKTSTAESEADGSSKVNTFRSKARTSVETAVSARENNNFDEAADAYNEAITQYQAAIEELDAGATETRTEIENTIDSIRTDLKTVKARNEQRDTVIEMLNAAEQRFQVAIVAYAQGSQTLARIRFRQARDSFEEAIEILEEGDNNLLTPPVEVSAQPGRELASTALSELPMIPETETVLLAGAGIETLEDLGSSEKPPWPPAAVETLENKETTSDEVVTTLTLLSWWNDTDSYEFDTIPAVSRRRNQADYGLTQSL